MNQSEWNLAKAAAQQGKVAIVTGANTGLGYETSLGLAEKGMKVVMACRNMQKANRAKEKIKDKYPFSDLECRQLDLSKLKSVRSFVKDFVKDYQSLDVLINNAGIMIPPFSLTEDGFESQMAANYFGHFVLTQGLSKLLLKSDKSRIISLSSIAHKQGKIRFDNLHSEKKYDAMAAYSQSKLACLIFAIELQRKLEQADSKTISLAAHPGVSNTELMRYLPRWSKLIAPILSPFISHNPKKGALPTLRAALDDSANGGDYYGPNGRRELKGKPIKIKPRRKALDVELANELWKKTEELTDCTFSI